MNVFNVIVGIFTIGSFFMTLFVAGKVIKIANKININVDSSKNQRVSGRGNKVAGGDIRND
ncbi:hypothetical protein MF628_003799 [Paenibacillus polymyxa]|uniref:hypothetical protein n=1 Tax=Paenibacillus polymyxa TaxID=1406 RepID=UPI002023C7C9|nr:hypothetical protein [Paenibacillus polymyxa]URJ44117.1 hypothetical protein MF628_003799 [Paenibacillus polymyxa]